MSEVSCVCASSSCGSMGFGDVFGPALQDWLNAPSAPPAAADSCGHYAERAARQACGVGDLRAADRIEQDRASPSSATGTTAERRRRSRAAGERDEVERQPRCEVRQLRARYLVEDHLGARGVDLLDEQLELGRIVSHPGAVGRRPARPAGC